MMTAERWGQLKELFEAALELPVEVRPAYVKEVCRGDTELQSELERLIADHESLGRFMSGAPSESGFSLEPGDILSCRFRIVRPLGKGGMGEVYEVFDEELVEASALK